MNRSERCEYYKKYREDNKDKLKYYKKYREDNKDKLKDYLRKYREKNKDYLRKYREKNRKYREENKDKLRESGKKYREENKDKIRQRNKKYFAENKDKLIEGISKRYKKDPNFRLKKLISYRVREELKKNNIKKISKSPELLGCTVQEAREHLEKQFKEGMTWENHGLYGWHIDHIIPCASFDLTDPDQQKKCFHYTNLQPLWAKENLIKGAKIL